MAYLGTFEGQNTPGDGGEAHGMAFAIPQICQPTYDAE